MKLNSKYRFVILAILVLVVFIFSPAADAWAQCPMCRIGAETNLAAGGTEGAGLNKGILLLLSLPYLLIGTFGFIWWKNKRKSSL